MQKFSYDRSAFCYRKQKANSAKRWVCRTLAGRQSACILAVRAVKKWELEECESKVRLLTAACSVSITKELKYLRGMSYFRNTMQSDIRYLFQSSDGSVYVRLLLCFVLNKGATLVFSKKNRNYERGPVSVLNHNEFISFFLLEKVY